MSGESAPKINGKRVPLEARVLRSLEMALLERVKPRQYKLRGLAPAFYLDLFPGAADGSPCDAPWQHSPMLEYFLGEAEDFFNDGCPGGVRGSGYWLETASDGRDVPLLASARLAEGAEVMLIHSAREDYAERTRILRQARNELLERQKVATDLDKYRQRALYDSLTKVYSRGAFSDILSDKVNAQRTQSRRTTSSELAALMLDIDHFKLINDEFGHLTGDAVLIQLGEILQDSLRVNDTPIRYGGEEFIVIAPNTNIKQSLALAEKLRKRVAAHDFGLGRAVTISIGCAVYVQGEDPDEFIGRADLALYEAKKSGRNRVCGRV